MVRASRNASNARRSGDQIRYPLACRIRNADDGVTRIDVYDDVGDGGWFSDGISAKDFAGQLAKVKGALRVGISSAGGDVFDGISIYNAIKGYRRGSVTTVVDGLAASIASVIFMGGQARVMADGAMLMIHDAFAVALGNEAELTEFAAVLGKVSDNIASIYADRSGGTPGYWRNLMRAETWYTADEAVAAGLADRVGEHPATLPSSLDLAALGVVPGRMAARLRNMPPPAGEAIDQLRAGLRQAAGSLAPSREPASPDGIETTPERLAQLRAGLAPLREPGSRKERP